MTNQPNEPNTPNEHHDASVDPEQACPWCGESCIDLLIWLEDDVVECHTCTCQYDPSEGLVWREGREEDRDRHGPRSDA